MSGVLLSVAFSLLRIKPIIDGAVGTGFMYRARFVVGLATVGVAAMLLTVTGDLKRMLAYSSMENMGLIAIVAAPARNSRSPRCYCTSWRTARQDRAVPRRRSVAGCP